MIPSLTPQNHLRDLQIIWTGFEPFGRHAHNPSWDVAQAAHAAALAMNLRSVAHQLPVTFDAARRFAAEQLDEAGPTLLIHLGLASDRASVCFERTARNWAGTSLDNAQTSCRSDGTCGAILPDRDDALRTTLPLDQLIASLQHLTDEAITLSDDAGDYVCNATYLHSLIAASQRRERGQLTHALFIHIPALDAERASALGASLARLLATWLTAP
jgi:pyroglutamyl-peptidase